ncbi:MAG: heme exporter protein CcmB [Rickettsiaceae bacterium]|nr:heme exporter protein CcmB [Rickettsiaceae bacterium]
MKTLLSQELLVQNKVYNLTKYSVLFFSFCIFSIALINSHNDVQKFGVIFSLVCIPLSFLSLANNLIKPDIEDGSLEYLLTISSAPKIILSKFLIMSIITFFCFTLITPLLGVFFSLQLEQLVFLLLTALLLILLGSALIVLIASIQGYFRSNTNFFAILIMPLILPNIILSGIFIQNLQEAYLLGIMLGINLVIIPPALYLSSYLIDNIYNI